MIDLHYTSTSARWARFGIVVWWTLFLLAVGWTWFGWAVTRDLTWSRIEPLNLFVLCLIWFAGSVPFLCWVLLRWIIFGRWMLRP